MRLLWRHWLRLSRELERAPHVLLLFDFDGTLAPIVEQPTQARMRPEARRALRRLAGLDRCTTGFISGRALSDLEDRVGVPGSFYAGNHGLEWEGPGVGPFRARLLGDARTELSRIKELVGRELGGVPGILVEDKGLSLSIHYRLVPKRFARDVRDYLLWLTDKLIGTVETHRGKRILEIRPAGGPDKGIIAQAIARAVQRQAGVTALTFYFGDDAGDEPAFAAVSRSGYGVHVGRPKAKSAAEFWVAGPDEVVDFLFRAADCLASERQSNSRAGRRTRTWSAEEGLRG